MLMLLARHEHAAHFQFLTMPPRPRGLGLLVPTNKTVMLKVGLQQSTESADVFTDHLFSQEKIHEFRASHSQFRKISTGF